MLNADVPNFLSEGLAIDLQSIDTSTILVKVAPNACRARDCAVNDLPLGVQQDRQFSLVSGLQALTLPANVDYAQALADLRQHPQIVYAEPNYRVHATLVPDDPRFDEMWGYHNTGQTIGTVDADIDMTEAWEHSVGSGNTIVAVIDTGVDYNHVDLAANMWRNTDEIPNDGQDNDGNGYVDDYFGYDFFNDDPDPFDDNDHGTHVAGTIAAVGNNGIGVTGVNWNAQIMALKFLDSSGNGSVADAIDALDYAVAEGATISNNSWGFASDLGSDALRDAIVAAQAADHLYVAAAGNGNIFGIGQDNDSTSFFPSSYDVDNIIAVAATDHNDNRAVFSNFGSSSVDVAAPGVNILSTTPGNSYSAFQGTSMASPHVAGLAALLRDVQPTWTYAQTRNQIFNTVDPLAAMQGISVTGGRINAAAALQGAAQPAPEILVATPLGEEIQDGTGEVLLRNTPPGLPATQAIMVTNVGTLPLQLDEPVSVPNGYSLVNSFGNTNLQPGESTSFIVQLDAATEGTFFGQISFGNNDEDEGPFDFTISGTVVTPPAVLIIDNGETDFSTTGEWTAWGGQGYQNDVHESLPGSGADVAQWSFVGMPVGSYRVSATWSAFGNRATNSPFSIWDGETQVGSAAVNQQLVPDDLVEAGTDWEHLGGVHSISSGLLVVTLNDNANGRLNADAIRIERLPDTPEIDVSVEGNGVSDDVGNVDFGTTGEGAPINRTFTVENLGLDTLTLDPTIVLPAGYQLISGFGQTSLQLGQSTTFVVQLQATTSGSYSGELSFDNNDPDEAPFNFSVTGTVDPPPPPVQIIDNGDPDFSTVGQWSAWGGQGYQNDIHESYPGNGSDVASWTFNSVLPGTYVVSATWSAFGNRATNSPFAIWDGETQVGSAAINQQLVADDFSDDGADWEQLGGLHVIDSGLLVVTLNDNADGNLNADAIRIERLPDTPEIRVSAEGSGVSDDVGTVDFGTTVESVPITTTFTVENLGLDTLTLDPTIVLPAGYQLISGFGQTSLQLGQSTTFVVQLQATTSGSYSGELSFGNNDPDEAPFNFSVTGTVDPPPPPVQIIDNGDPDFSTVGQWSAWGGQGYQNDIHESYPGNGSDVASWTFNSVLPGTYVVSATWSAFGNRATNSPFAIWDGETQVGSAAINQQLVADDFSDDGADWEQLGGLHVIDSGLLVVTLNDNADGNLNADAIRIERLPDTPEIRVSAEGSGVSDDVGTVDFGTTVESVPITTTFTVENLGLDTLTLDPTIVLPAGYQLISGFGQTSLQLGQSTTFVVQLQATTSGSYSGELSFGNNDPDEAPFNFSVTGTVDPPPPPVQIIDNGDPDFSTVGQWSAWGGQGYQNDIHESYPGNGSDVASWTFNSVLPGTYVVSATWSAFGNRATNSPFAIWDGETQVGSAAINQQLVADDFSDDGADWEQLGGLHVIDSGLLVVTLNDNADGNLNADAIRIERLPDTPEIRVSAEGSGVSDDVGTVDFGTTVESVPITTTFTVENLGLDTLTLDPTIVLPAGYQLISGFGQTSLQLGQSTTFVVQLQATTSGSYSGELSFGNNDPDEAPFNFSVTGTVDPPPPPVQIIDNGDPDFSIVGRWRQWSGQGYQNDVHEDRHGDGSDKARWTFSNVLPGTYRVAVTWTAYKNRATNSPFSIWDEGTQVGGEVVNQKLAPDDFSDAGTNWEQLDGLIAINGGVIIVELNDDADGNLIADAIRIERLNGLGSLIAASVPPSVGNPLQGKAFYRLSQVEGELGGGEIEPSISDPRPILTIDLRRRARGIDRVLSEPDVDFRHDPFVDSLATLFAEESWWLNEGRQP